MKKILLILLACLPLFAIAKDNKEKNNSDPKYLAGALTYEDGKITFTREINAPGLSKDEIYQRMLDWANERFQPEDGMQSRVVYTNKEDGDIAASAEEWMVFSSTALSLDRTRVYYQLTAKAGDGQCLLTMSRIRYWYDEARDGGEKYTAEEWITDKYALNKAQTKLVRGLAKWRRKTVDFVDELALGATEALSAATANAPAEEKKEEKTVEKSVINSGPIVIAPKKQVTIESAQSQPAGNNNVISGTESNTGAGMPNAQVIVPSVQVKKPAALVPANKAQQQAYKEVAPDQLSAAAIQTGAGRLVIVIGEDPFNMTMMTANSGGSLGKVNGKPVIFSILSPDQPYEQIEKAENYIIRFYPTGQTEPTVILECNKLPSPATMEGMPRTYVGEILKAMVK